MAPCTSILACEPIFPFIMAAGGPALLLRSITALLIAIAVKALVFAFLQEALPFGRAAIYMVIGNVLTTFIGAIAAVLMGSGMAGWIIGMPIVVLLCLPAASRFVNATRDQWPGRFSRASVAGAMTVGFAASCVLFGVAFHFQEQSLAYYWTFKIAAIYVALLVSIALTAFWEEWVVWRLSRLAPESRVFVNPAIKSNLIIFLGVALYAAILVSPSRLRAPRHLIQNSSPAHENVRSTQEGNGA